MKKKIKLLLLIGIASVLMAGCSSRVENNLSETEGTIETDDSIGDQENTNPFELEMVGCFKMNYSRFDGQTFYYYRDVITDQLFLEIRAYSNTHRAITAMSDPETGLPLTYARYLELYEEHKKNEQ